MTLYFNNRNKSEKITYSKNNNNVIDNALFRT